jgi:hypothetical protein
LSKFLCVLENEQMIPGWNCLSGDFCLLFNIFFRMIFDVWVEIIFLRLKNNWVIPHTSRTFKFCYIFEFTIMSRAKYKRDACLFFLSSESKKRKKYTPNLHFAKFVLWNSKRRKSEDKYCWSLRLYIEGMTKIGMWNCQNVS